MSFPCPIRRHRAWRRGSLAAIVLGLAWHGTAVAAPPEGGGLSFGIDERVELSSNLTLTPISQGRTVRSDTALSLSYLTETRRERLSFDASTVLRYADGPAGTDTGFADPRIRLSYARNGANARFLIEADLRWNDIAYLRPLEDFLDPETGLTLPSDLDDLVGQGTRIDRSLSASLSYGDDGPFGATFNIGASDLAYRDTTDPELRDSQRLDLGVDLRLTLSPATDLTLGLGYSRIDREGSDARTIREVDLALAHGRPNGELTFGLSLEDFDGERRHGLRLGRSLALPRGVLEIGIGATEHSGGEVSLTGDLTYRQDLPRGTLSAGLQRGLTSDGDGEDSLLTSLSLGMSHAVNERTDIGFDMAYVRSDALGSGTDLESGSLGINLSRDLTEDWAATVGYRYRTRQEGSAPRAHDNSIYVTLSRSFDYGR